MKRVSYDCHGKISRIATKHFLPWVSLKYLEGCHDSSRNVVLEHISDTLMPD